MAPFVESDLDELQFYTYGRRKRPSSKGSSDLKTIRRELAIPTLPSLLSVIHQSKSLRKGTKSTQNVRFSLSSNTVHDTISRDNYNQEERVACWYSQKEINLVMDHNLDMLLRLEDGLPCKKNDSYRGLEGKTEEGQIMTDRDRFHAIDLVLDEQERARSQKRSFDPEHVRAMYREVTETTRYMAITLARRDEREAQEVYASTLDLDRSDSRLTRKTRKSPKPERKKRPKSEKESKSLLTSMGNTKSERHGTREKKSREFDKELKVDLRGEGLKPRSSPSYNRSRKRTTKSSKRMNHLPES